jgi:hypothetical protein
MAKLIYSMLTSPDGYTEDEHGQFGWGAPECASIPTVWLPLEHNRCLNPMDSMRCSLFNVVFWKISGVAQILPSAARLDFCQLIFFGRVVGIAPEHDPQGWFGKRG